MLTEVCLRPEAGRRADHVARLSAHVPVVGKDVGGSIVCPFGDWHWAQERIFVELVVGRGGGVEVSIIGVVVVSHWDSIKRDEESEERSCCKRRINGVGLVRKKTIQLSVA